MSDCMVLSACGLGAIGSIYMALRGHNRVIFMTAVSFVWTAASYALDMLDLINNTSRMSMVRGGVIMLGISMFAGSFAWWARRRRIGR